MAARFQAIRPKSREEFDWLIEHITHEAYRARDNWDAWVAIDKACDKYAIEINQTPGFWGLTRRAHKDAFILRLGRLYDPHPGSTSLGNLLQTIKTNILHSGRVFPAAIAMLHAPDIDAEMTSVSDDDKAVEKLLAVRNEYLAHRGTKHVTKGNFKALPTIPEDDLSGLLTKAINIIGKYRQHLGYSSLGWGHDEGREFRRILKLLRAGTKALTP